MDRRELEKLKYAVLNMYFSALLLCAVCWPVVFWTDENILNMGIPMFFATGILSVYNFVRQTIFLSRHPNYQKSKNRFLYDTISYLCCIGFAVIIGLVELFNNFKSWQIAAILSLKIYYVLFVAVTMVILMSSAHRLNKIWEKFMKSEEPELYMKESERSHIRVYPLWGTFMAGIGSITILFVGVGNILYYFLPLPILISSLILFLIYFIQGVRRNYFKQIKLWKVIIGSLCIVVLILISHFFTHASTIVEYEKINVEFEIYTFVILIDIILIIASFIIFYRIGSTKTRNS